MASDIPANGGERLDSWKAISTYLGRDEGTLRRWERTRGLPIRRVPGRRGGSVYAYKAEIEAWLQTPIASAPDDAEPSTTPFSSPVALPERSVTRGPWLIRAGVLLVVVASIAAVGWLSRVSPSSAATTLRVAITESAVTATDEGGRVLWSHQHGEGHRHVLSTVSEQSRVITGVDPAVYVASAHRLRLADNQVSSGRLTRLDLTGRLRWSVEFDDHVTIGGSRFSGPWATAGFSVDERVTPHRVALTAHDYTWSPGIVSVLDGAGQRVARFVNNGWLEQAQWVGPDRLVVGGYSESGSGGMVALLDTTRADARAPDEGAHRCDSCGHDLPLRVAVFPRSEVNLASRSRFNRAVLDYHGDRLVARTSEVPSTGQGAAEAIFEFTPDLTLIRAAFSAWYWQEHDELFAAKVLDHDRSRCPDRDGPRSYRLWTPEEGWATVTLR